MATKHALVGLGLERGAALGTDTRRGHGRFRPGAPLVIQLGAARSAESFARVGRVERRAAMRAIQMPDRILAQLGIMRRQTIRCAIDLVMNALGLGWQLPAAPFAKHGRLQKAKLPGH